MKRLLKAAALLATVTLFDSARKSYLDYKRDKKIDAKITELQTKVSNYRIPEPH